MTPHPEDLLSALALVAKMRAAQKRPSIVRTFYSGPDRETVLHYEAACDRALALLLAAPEPEEPK